MSEYIERGALIEFLKRQYCESCRENGEDGAGIVCRACVVAYVLEKIEDTPAADVVEVKHGVWDFVAENSTGKIFLCSCCGIPYNPSEKEVDRGRLQEKPNYCPNCGAKMDGE